MSDVSALAGVAAEFIKNMPQIMQAVQIVAYVFLVLFFGSIAVIGYRGYLGFWRRLGLRLVLGFICLVSGIALAGFIPFFNGGIWSLLQVNMLAATLLSSVVLAVCVFMLSFRLSRVKGLEKAIESLQRKLSREKSRGEPRHKLIHPVVIAGGILFVVFFGFAFLNFHGFPNFGENILNSIGISAEDFEKLGETLEKYNMSGECVSMLNMVAQHQSELQDSLESYENQVLKTAMEQKAGSAVAGSLLRAEYQGTPVVIGFMENNSTCYATESEVCICQ